MDWRHVSFVRARAREGVCSVCARLGSTSAAPSDHVARECGVNRLTYPCPAPGPCTSSHWVCRPLVTYRFGLCPISRA